MMDEKLKQTLAAQASPIRMSEQQAERWQQQALARPQGKPLRLPSRRRRWTLIVALSLCLALLAGFGYQLLSPYFEKAFVEDNYGAYGQDLFEEYEKTGEIARILATLEPGEVYQAEVDISDSTLRITLIKGDTLDSVSYGVRGQRGRVYTLRYHNAADGYLPYTGQQHSRAIDVEEYAAEGNFLIALAPDYSADFEQPSLYLEDGEISRLEYVRSRRSLTDAYAPTSISIRFVQELSYRIVEDIDNVITEDITINSRIFTYIENVETSPYFRGKLLLLHLGDDHFTRNVFIDGEIGQRVMTRDELLEIAEHLVFYNEEANRKDYPAFTTYGDLREDLTLAEALELATLTPDNFLQLAWFPAQYFTAFEDSYYEQEFWCSAYHFTDPNSGLTASLSSHFVDYSYSNPQTALDALISDHGSMDLIAQDRAGNYYGVYHNSPYMEQEDYTAISTIQTTAEGFRLHIFQLPTAWLPDSDPADWFR